MESHPRVIDKSGRHSRSRHFEISHCASIWSGDRRDRSYQRDRRDRGPVARTVSGNQWPSISGNHLRGKGSISGNHLCGRGSISGNDLCGKGSISGKLAITCAERDPSVAITCAEGDHHWRARPALKLAYALSTPHSSLWGRWKRWAPVVIRGNQWPSIAITCGEGGSGGPRWPDQWSAAVRRGNHARGHQDPTALCLKGARSAPSPACRPTCSHSQSRHRSH